MRSVLILLLSTFTITVGAQTLIKCNDTTFYYVNNGENSYCYIRLKGEVVSFGNDRVIKFKNQALQALLVDNGPYSSNGKEDMQILKSYMTSESDFNAVSLKQKLKTTMVPVELSKEKQALVWYFDLPEFIQKQGNQGGYAIKQVYISQTVGNYVYSLVTTQFNTQSLDSILQIMTDLSKTMNYRNGKIQQNLLCE
jgi:CHASE2 domain-containing sensor protein